MSHKDLSENEYRELAKQVDDAFPKLPRLQRPLSESEKAVLRDPSLPDQNGVAITSDGTIWQHGIPVADLDRLVEEALRQDEAARDENRTDTTTSDDRSSQSVHECRRETTELSESKPAKLFPAEARCREARDAGRCIRRERYDALLMTVFPDWQPVIACLRKTHGPPTPAQRALARRSGVGLDGGEPTPVVAALLLDALAGPLGRGAAEVASPAQLSYLIALRRGGCPVRRGTWRWRSGDQ